MHQPRPARWVNRGGPLSSSDYSIGSPSVADVIRARDAPEDEIMTRRAICLV